jgi:glycosyltransferase involved in cell wall biosynthesis
MCDHFGKDKEVLPFDIFVFGGGRFAKKTKQASTKRRNFYYFGRQPLSVISRYIKNCHYCLMPSDFLETFGLSAVNALAW